MTPSCTVFRGRQTSNHEAARVSARSLNVHQDHWYCSLQRHRRARPIRISRHVSGFCTKVTSLLSPARRQSRIREPGGPKSINKSSRVETWPFTSSRHGNTPMQVKRTRVGDTLVEDLKGGLLPSPSSCLALCIHEGLVERPAFGCLPATCRASLPSSKASFQMHKGLANSSSHQQATLKSKGKLQPHPKHLSYSYFRPHLQHPALRPQPVPMVPI